MKSTNVCPVCGSFEINLFLKTKDYFLTKEAFSLLKCDQCSYVSTNPAPTEKELPKYYNSDQYLSHTAANKGVLNRIYEFSEQSISKGNIRLLNSINRLVSY
jgi:hypothetical protein